MYVGVVPGAHRAATGAAGRNGCREVQKEGALESLESPFAGCPELLVYW
jgi:hypothetical protein